MWGQHDVVEAEQRVVRRDRFGGENVETRSSQAARAQRFHECLLVDDPAVKAAIGPIYRECLGGLWSTYYKPRVDAAAADPDAPSSKAFVAMRASAQYLADNFETYPLFLFGFAKGDASKAVSAVSITTMPPFMSAAPGAFSVRSSSQRPDWKG